MNTVQEKISNKLGDVLEARITKAIEQFDVETAIKSVEDRLLKEAIQVTDALLGINRQWSTPQIGEGLLRSTIEEKIGDFIEKKLAPKIEAAWEKRVDLKTVQASIDADINRAIERAINERLSSYGNVYKEIERRVASEIDASIADKFGVKR